MDFLEEEVCPEHSGVDLGHCGIKCKKAPAECLAHSQYLARVALVPERSVKGSVKPWF